MLDYVVVACLAGLSFSLLLAAFRALKGPRVTDRVVALDGAAVVLMALVVTGSMHLGETKYLDYALVLAVLSFATTIAFAKYVERGTIIDVDNRDRD